MEPNRKPTIVHASPKCNPVTNYFTQLWLNRIICILCCTKNWLSLNLIHKSAK
uniref:Uncharacterized protein n=1 Tax=Arundo donax TaxID=35708 RepID=A0A0A9DZY0_ARUDO